MDHDNDGMINKEELKLILMSFSVKNEKSTIMDDWYYLTLKTYQKY